MGLEWAASWAVARNRRRIRHMGPGGPAKASCPEDTAEEAGRAVAAPLAEKGQASERRRQSRSASVPSRDGDGCESHLSSSFSYRRFVGSSAWWPAAFS